MLYVLNTIHVVVCLFLILVVLLQQGKGADLSVFGGGGTQTAFGARGAATLLHKLTVFSFVAFIVTTVGIGFIKSGGTAGSVMSDIAEEQVEEVVPEPEALPADAEAPTDEGAAPGIEGAVGEGPAPVTEVGVQPAPAESEPAGGGDEDGSG